jgi:hypothetical protein
MNGNGAYGGEMNEVVLFEKALRAAVPTRPDPALGTTLVPRLAGLARAATLEAEKHAVRTPAAAPRSRRTLVARVAIAVAVIPLVFAGLAFAGVTVPGPARDAFDAVGISLPNQPAKHAHRHGDGSSHGRGAGSEATTDGTTTDRGNSDTAHEHALEQHQKAQGKALGHEKGKAIGLNGATPPGQEKKADKPSHPSHPGNGGGNSATHTTTHTKPEHPTAPGGGQGGQGNGNANGHTK